MKLLAILLAVLGILLIIGGALTAVVLLTNQWYGLSALILGFIVMMVATTIAIPVVADQRENYPEH